MKRFFLKLHRAFLNSWNGLSHAWNCEWAFRVELIITVIALPCAYFVASNAVEYVLLLGSMLLILMMELMNSAIEATVNRIGLEHHELSGLAKDLASSAVLLVIINALVIWIIIFFL